MLRNEQLHWLDSDDALDVLEVGGKAARLAALTGRFDVPPGFVIVAEQPTSDFSPVASAYSALGERCGDAEPAVAVRSSAADEDASAASFAGQHETLLNVRGIDALAVALDACFASANSAQAIAYRRSSGLGPSTRVAVLVQAMVVADVSLVAFSVNPVNGAAFEIIINASWGLGPSVVGGTVTPDEVVIERGPGGLSIEARKTREKACMTVALDTGIAEVPVPRALRCVMCLSDDAAIATAQLVVDVAAALDMPVDVEAAWGADRLHLLQARPITTRQQARYRS